jgi:hypothetical protein
MNLSNRINFCGLIFQNTSPESNHRYAAACESGEIIECVRLKRARTETKLLAKWKNCL